MTNNLVKIDADLKRNRLEAMLSRVIDLRPALEEWVAMRRDLIQREFDQQAWLRPGGGTQPWLPTKAFGNRPAPTRTLQRSGALLRAYLGKGRGAIEQYGPNTAAFGVSGNEFPAAVVHRGGAGKVGVADSRRTTDIKVTAKMRGFLGAAFGVYLRIDKKLIRIPARPHATESPESRTRRAAIFSRHVRGLALEAGRGAN